MATFTLPEFGRFSYEETNPYLKGFTESLKALYAPTALKQAEEKESLANQLSKNLLPLTVQNQGLANRELLAKALQDEFKSRYPLLGQEGTAGQLGALAYLQGNPTGEYAPNLAQTTTSSGESNLMPSNENGSVETNVNNAFTAIMKNLGQNEQAQNFQGPKAVISGAQSNPELRNALKTMAPNGVIPKNQPLRPLDQEQKSYADLLRSDIEAQIEAKKNKNAYGTSRTPANIQRQVDLERQVAFDHPEWTSQQVGDVAGAYMTGAATLPDGSIVPEPSEKAKIKLSAIAKDSSTAAIQNTAASWAKTTKDIEAIPEDVMAEYAGLGGAIKFRKFQSLEAASSLPGMQFLAAKIPPSYYAFKQQLDAGANLNMDALRKSFATSVVPSYVMKTLGYAVNPTHFIYNNAEQVKYDLVMLKRYMRVNNEMLQAQVHLGATANLDKINEKAKKLDEEYNKHMQEKYKSDNAQSSNPQNIKSEAISNSLNDDKVINIRKNANGKLERY